MHFKRSIDIVQTHKEYFDQVLIQELDDLNHKYANAKNKIQILNASKVRTSNQMVRKNFEIKKLKADKRALKDDLRSRKEESAEDKKKIIRLEKENAALKAESSAAYKEAAAERERRIAAEAENKKLSSQLKYSQTRETNLKTENLAQKEELKDLRTQMRALQDQYDLRFGESAPSEAEARIEELEQTVEGLTQKNKKQTQSNSETSNYPTSADMPGRTAPRANINSRERTGRPRGGQKGHPVHKSQLQVPTTVKTLYVKQIPSGAQKHKDENGKEYWTVQEIDLSIQTVITEIRMYRDTENGEELDASIMKTFKVNPVAYSAGFRSKVHYLNIESAIPLQRIATLLSVLSDGKISLKPSTICKWNEKFKVAGEDQWKAILADILSRPIVHVDETGVSVDGNRAWVHTLCNEAGCVFFITRTRGDREKGPLKYLENYQGTVVSDHFAGYLSLECRAECMAHIERYLKAGVVLDENKHCKAILEIQHKMKSRKDELISQGKTGMEKEELDSLVMEYRAALKAALDDFDEWAKKNEKRVSVYKPDYVKTWKRIYEDTEPYVHFLADFSVPYTNNFAELQMRKVKGKKNSSGQFVSFDGTRSYAVGLSLVQTAKIRNENPLRALERVMPR